MVDLDEIFAVIEREASEGSRRVEVARHLQDTADEIERLRTALEKAQIYLVDGDYGEEPELRDLIMSINAALGSPKCDGGNDG